MVTVCAYMCVYTEGFFQLQDVCDALEGYGDQRRYVVSINAGISAKFLHLHF